MADTPLFDRLHLSEQTGGDEALARELLVLFHAQCERLLPAITDPGLPRARRADFAHTLKGSALGIGARAVDACAARIEDALRSNIADPEGAIAALSGIAEATLAQITEPD